MDEKLINRFDYDGDFMSVRRTLDRLIGKIETILKTHEYGSDLDWNGINLVVKAVSDASYNLRLKQGNDVQYGRYLVYNTDNFNIQLDVFSENYEGKPHNHETWGVMGVISGTLGVTDYHLSNNKLNTIRKSILKNGATSGFKAFDDWHSTETFEYPQVASFHIYGKDFNLDQGKRYVEGKGIEDYTRGALYMYEKNHEILIMKG